MGLPRIFFNSRKFAPYLNSHSAVLERKKHSSIPHLRFEGARSAMKVYVLGEKKSNAISRGQDSYIIFSVVVRFLGMLRNGHHFSVVHQMAICFLQSGEQKDCIGTAGRFPEIGRTEAANKYRRIRIRKRQRGIA